MCCIFILLVVAEMPALFDSEPSLLPALAAADKGGLLLDRLALSVDELVMSLSVRIVAPNGRFWPPESIPALCPFYLSETASNLSTRMVLFSKDEGRSTMINGVVLLPLPLPLALMVVFITVDNGQWCNVQQCVTWTF